jgi:uncharacterized protein YndB with AHSA1/START domain
VASNRAVSVTRVIAAPPEVIFDILADPSRHAEIDGSGTVVKARGEVPRLALGSRFGMDMKMGVPYRMVSTVVDFEEGRRIAWRHVGGHTWRYDLEPTDAGTAVTETFDWSTSKAPWFIELARFPKRHPPAMEKTLERLEAAATARPTS